ncbi:amidohydrolase family protein [Synergistes jonesii]|uniref:amidohydrolase family protein n=1 Tax=Synergistes jonesii TaxID=2754 RepID=UPI00242FEAB9|nr:amidohydrolase family protein [Synergistes jonesii]
MYIAVTSAPTSRVDDFKILVRRQAKCRVPALRTLVAATSANAKIVGRSDIGEIVQGKLADIAGWRRDVLSDFDALSECSFVMKEGVIYKNL